MGYPNCREKVLWALVILCFGLIFYLDSAFALDWYVTPSIRVSEEYDSNVLFRSDDVLDDFITIVYPELKIFAESDRSRFLFDTIIAGKKYIKNSNLDTVENDTRASLMHAWSDRWTSDFNLKFTRDTTLESQLEEAGIATRRVERYLYDLGTAQTYRFSETLSTTVSINSGQIYYPDGTFPDSTYWQASIRPGLAISDRDVVGIDTVYSYRDYVESSTIQYLQQLLYWQRKWNETTRFTLGGGYLMTFTETPFMVLEIVDDQLVFVEKKEQSTNFGFSFLATLEKDWTERLKTSLSAGRDEYSTSDAQTYERNYLRADASYRFSELTSFSCGLSYYLNNQRGEPGETINYVQVSPSAVRKITEDLFLTLAGSFAYQIREAESIEATADRFRTWLQLTWQFPRMLD